MSAKMFGQYTEEEFSGELALFQRENIQSEDELRAAVSLFHENGSYDIFKEAYREFLLDESQTFADRALRYFGHSWPSSVTWDYLQWIWEHLAPGEPWPLEGRPRPEDEPASRKHEFKPD